MLHNNIHISVVSPVYRGEQLVDELVRRIKSAIEQITPSYEIILVEDGSPDTSWEKIETVCKTDDKIKGIKLSRNFGQHYAITAGLDQVNGEWIVVMDCDLQDRPEAIHLLYKKAIEGYAIVLAKRIQRKDGFLKRTSSKLFYTVLSYLTGTSQDPAIANFGIYHSKVIKSVNMLREPIRYFPTMVRWVGFTKTFVNIDHGERFSGQTTYNWKKLFRLAFDIILANSDKPIRMIAKTGFLIAFLSFAFGVFILVRYFTDQITVPGYTSILVSLWFIGGMMMMFLGIIGLYIGKIFEGVKQRPVYFIDKTVNL